MCSHSWVATRVTNRTCDKHRDVEGVNAGEREEEEEMDMSMGDWEVESGEELVRTDGVDVAEERPSVTPSGRRRVVGEGGRGESFERGPRRRVSRG